MQATCPPWIVSYHFFSLPQLVVEERGVKAHTTAVVLGKLCCDVLLGSDLLRQFGTLQVDYRTNEVNLGAEVGRCKVICREARLVRSYSTVRVPVRREGLLCAWNTLLESSLSLWSAKGVSTG